MSEQFTIVKAWILRWDIGAWVVTLCPSWFALERSPCCAFQIFDEALGQTLPLLMSFDQWCRTLDMCLGQDHTLLDETDDSAIIDVSLASPLSIYRNIE